ncbi:MAG: glycosyltransferase family 2 protein [Nitrospirae bacterium]|nr:glycosyltransferase family 2 protein [Nitrospirota bacterium]MBF0540199.1 glycosyltransferase family 2 protein [Nitrospirota bacterium]
MANKTISISIIIPALNEQDDINDVITKTLKAFSDFNINGEIIVINDGSTDKTKERVTEAMADDERVRLINHERPQGIGASFWDGVDNAMGDTVCMLPGDNEINPLETLRYFMLLEHVDIVIPFVYNKEVRSLFRNGLSYLYRFIVNTSFLVNFNYTNGTIIYRKSILNELAHRSNGFFFQTDILIRSVKKGYLFAEVPYRLYNRGSGSSKAVSFPSLVQVIKGYLRLLKEIYSDSSRIENNFSKDSQTQLRRSQKDNDNE